MIHNSLLPEKLVSRLKRDELCIFLFHGVTKKNDFPTNDKDALIGAIKSFKNIDKKEVQEMTWEKHNKDTWKKHFVNCIDKTIEKFNKKSRNLFELKD